MLAVAVVVVAPGSAGASGATLVINSNTSSIYGGFSSTDSGTTWSSYYQFMQTGRDTSSSLLVEEFRWAFELPLAALPTDATITSAILQLRTANPDLAGQTALVGYAGDGAVTLGDADVMGPQVLFTPTVPAYQAVDVTTLITAGARSAGFVGFSLRQSPVGSTYTLWDSPEFFNPPFLTITYTTPDPTTTTSTPPTTSTADSSVTTLDVSVSAGGEVVPAFTG
ncbi:MAG: hypothetical protein MUE36_12265 [Acidimicrobiales bacterium]|nr:hypothetical protein [Acidimicrobiales bacterium]